MGNSNSAQADFLEFLAHAANDPPDPNAPLPLGNQPRVIYGVTIPFLILAWAAVGFRLHTRIRVVREPGIDDALIVIAAIFNLTCLVALLAGLKQGIGKHLLYVLDIFKPTMIYIYITNAAYVTTSVLVKLSLLCQYLRLFRGDYRHTVTRVLLIIVALWGSTFMFMAWFPCFPVSGFWTANLFPPAKCYGFGYRNIKETKNTLFAFSGSNMVLDVAIFLLPLTEYFRPGLKRKQVLAMTGLFAFGFIVILMAFLRLWAGVRNNNTPTMLDFTWWMSNVYLFSCLEVDFAIICASMPIFWPTVVATWTEIFVTDEVIVRHDRRSHIEDDKEGTRKSHDSTLGLTKSSTQGDDPFFTTFNPETGTGPGSGIALVEIQHEPSVQQHGRTPPKSHARYTLVPIDVRK